MTELSDFIDRVEICNTHEHQHSADEWATQKPDVLQLLFENYVASDLRVAGGTTEQIHRLVEIDDEDIAARFDACADLWERSRHTGYAEAVALAAKHFFGIDELTGPALATAQETLPKKWPVDERRRILREEGRFDHVQINHFKFTCDPDPSGPDFFFYDLAFAGFCNGFLEHENIVKEVGIEVKDMASLKEAIEAIFAKNAPCAIGVKAQHAYSRTLAWRKRTDDEAAAALVEALKIPYETLDEATRICLGDWCWQLGATLCVEHDLAFKLHTGYYAGHSRMVMDRIHPSHLCPLVLANPDCRFVLMHIGYPFEDELVAMAKHFPNVWADLCWAWAINPHAGMNFVRKLLTAAPTNRLLGFGGDTGWPHMSVGYGLQARRWLTRTLQAEIDEGFMTEPQAITAARRIFHENAYEVFNVAATRAAIAERAAGR